MLLSVAEFIGHLHPVLVHLPIGILLMACLFLWKSRHDKSKYLKKTIRICLGLGMISAIFTCITGYVLSRTGDYEEGSTDTHQWMGFIVAAVSIVAYYSSGKNHLQKWNTFLAFILLVLILITGHLGGSLTHGAGYLTDPFLKSDSTDSIPKRKPIARVQEAFVYGDIIQPVFQEKCYSCHGPKKQKGKLRLDQPDLIMKGGKDGVVILPGKADSSELIKRIFLPLEDDHHMSPKEKRQLTDKEKMLIRWWVDQGADFSKKVKDIQQPGNIKPVLLALESTVTEHKDEEDIPPQPVDHADDGAVSRIRQLGAIIQPVSQNSNYLEVNFMTSTHLKNADLSLLLPVKKQLVWLRLSHMPVSDSSLAIVGQCSNLIRLQLDHTKITDRGLQSLNTLTHLRVLNIVGTSITTSGVLALKDLKNLHTVYLYRTKIEKREWALLKSSFPHAVLDSGGYMVPLFPTDTMIVKPPPIKN